MKFVFLNSTVVIDENWEELYEPGEEENIGVGLTVFDNTEPDLGHRIGLTSPEVEVLCVALQRIVKRMEARKLAKATG